MFELAWHYILFQIFPEMILQFLVVIWIIDQPINKSVLNKLLDHEWKYKVTSKGWSLIGCLKIPESIVHWSPPLHKLIFLYIKST